MPVALLVMALQLHSASLADVGVVRASASDSVRDLARARGAQHAFERSRRASLPWGSGGAGRCEVRLGRFCWWYDEHVPEFPPEPDALVRRRSELLAMLDLLSIDHPGDDWLAGMRVHYRVDARRLAEAEGVARTCAATRWWCDALVGYAAHLAGRERISDSAFASAVAAMPTDVACAWRSIAPLLPDEARGRYERLACEARRSTEQRYWQLSRPQLAADANSWRNEFNARQLLVRLAEHSATPQNLSWGTDAAELLLRYGWPTAWTRIPVSSTSTSEPSIVGHDPSPSFTFAPESFSDSSVALSPDSWDLHVPTAASRYAPPLVRRIADAVAQLARFRRGDSTLLVARFTTRDDSLRQPLAVLAAGVGDSVRSSAAIDAREGVARLMLAGAPGIAGVEIADTASRTLARMRVAFAPLPVSARLGLSDLLVFRSSVDSATSVDSVLAHAIAGDTVAGDRRIGLFWETYGLASGGEAVDVAVSVERIDRSWVRSARQRLGLESADTPIRIRWNDAHPPKGSAAPHAVSLDLSDVEPGRYRITLSLAPAIGLTVTTSRELTLLAR